MKKSQYLIKLMEDLIREKISPLVFVNKYEKFFTDNWVMLEREVNKNIFDIFCDLNMDLGYFVPDPKLRKEYEYYFDEKFLIKEVKIIYEKLKEEIKRRNRR